MEIENEIENIEELKSIYSSFNFAVNGSILLEFGKEFAEKFNFCSTEFHMTILLEYISDFNTQIDFPIFFEIFSKLNNNTPPSFELLQALKVFSEAQVIGDHAVRNNYYIIFF